MKIKNKATGPNTSIAVVTQARRGPSSSGGEGPTGGGRLSGVGAPADLVQHPVGGVAGHLQGIADENDPSLGTSSAWKLNWILQIKRRQIRV